MGIKSVYFITGTSRGIGKALAELLLSREGNYVTGISRSCSISHERYNHIAADLSDPAVLRSWNFPALENVASVNLVNNSGMLGEVKYAGHQQAEIIQRAFNLNLVAPAVLTNAFLSAYQATGKKRVVLNISSGAAKNPIDGWNIYCASKAGLDHFTRTVALEQEKRGNSHVHLFSVAPGIVDTAMQDEIRNAEMAEFSRLDEFIGYKKSDRLAGPDLIARKLLSILDVPEKFGDAVFSVKDIESA